VIVARDQPQQRKAFAPDTHVKPAPTTLWPPKAAPADWEREVKALQNQLFELAARVRRLEEADG
jgi:hypothetical protein